MAKRLTLVQIGLIHPFAPFPRLDPRNDHVAPAPFVEFHEQRNERSPRWRNAVFNMGRFFVKILAAHQAAILQIVKLALQNFFRDAQIPCHFAETANTEQAQIQKQEAFPFSRRAFDNIPSRIGVRQKAARPTAVFVAPFVKPGNESGQRLATRSQVVPNLDRMAFHRRTANNRR